MAYATRDDILTRFDPEEIERLTDGVGAPVAGVIDAAIAASESLVDSYLRSAGYPTPFPSPVPKVLTDVTSYLSIERIYARQPAAEIPPPLERLIDWAYSWLNQLLAGATDLPTPTSSSSGSNANAAVKSLSRRPDILTAMNEEYSE
jgi:phage gp36-like protein